MEIELELDNGFICDFEPEFNLTVNRSNIEKVQWDLYYGTDSYSVADVFDKPPDEGDSTVRILPYM